MSKHLGLRVHAWWGHREAGGLANLVGVLQIGLETLESRPELVEAVLHALLALCMDEEGREGVHNASGISTIMRLLEVQNLSPALQDLAARLVLRLAYTAVNKNAIRWDAVLPQTTEGEQGVCACVCACACVRVRVRVCACVRVQTVGLIPTKLLEVHNLSPALQELIACPV